MLQTVQYILIKERNALSSDELFLTCHQRRPALQKDSETETILKYHAGKPQDIIYPKNAKQFVTAVIGDSIAH